MTDWYGADVSAKAHYGAVIDAGRRGQLDADQALNALIVDGSKPAIVRATALSLLPQFTANVTREMINAYLAGVGDADPLVRAAAVDAFRLRHRIAHR